MKEQHLTEEQLQEYASGVDITAAANAHLSHCEHCTGLVAEYRLLFADLKNTPPPGLGFDVAALVIPVLPVAAEQGTDRPNRYLLPVIAIIALLIPAIAFRTYFFNILTTIPVSFIYPLLIIPVLFILFRILQLYRMYLRKIEALNIL